ncbi:MAG: right-handed parallel beta-helix repeat-containing protein, partial [Pyrinomonadaceae bacterium]|nr:right-handed parallel beta-helix repeat-containing protein [Pyrinomonadaceae bacterium]
AAQAIDFESPGYTLGNINGQNGWMKTGPYDVAVSPSGGTAGFGLQSFRISNASTSGSFGDWAISPSNANEAGEAGAANGGLSGGTRKNYFEASFSIASAVPGAQQPGLQAQFAPDRGDGSRMSSIRFEDQPDGIHVMFFDYQDLAPFGTSLGDAVGCGTEDNFFQSDIATLDRTVPHTIKIEMYFVDGPRNDVVKVYIDGVLKKVGTSWEDYFRYCEGNPTRTVDSLIFLARSGAGTAPATLGFGFLIDGLSMSSGAQSVAKVTSLDLGLSNWFMFNDETNTVDNSMVSFVSGPSSPVYGSGSAQVSVTGTQRRNLSTSLFGGTNLSAINTMKFRTYNPSAGNGGSASRSGYLNFNVDFNASNTYQNRLVFVPSQNGAVAQNAWKEWDAINGGSALWSFSGTTWPAGIGGGGEPGTTLKTWTQILSQYPSAKMLALYPFTGIRVGEPYPDGYTENIDSFTFGTSAGTTVYDFEPLLLQVDDDSIQCPGAGYSTIQSAINAAGPGATVQVCAGTYTEDINVNKAGLTLIGAGVDVSTIIGPHLTGDGNTVLITASGVTVDGFTITRTGNTVGDWVSNPQSQGVNVAASSGFTLQNSKLTGNRNAIYVGQSSNNVTIRRNIIDFNRTGIHLVDNNGATIEENFITNNWTMGILYRTEGGAAPTQMTVRGNHISGNWFSDIEFREPAGVAALNMSGNYLGTTNPTRVVTELMEPGYTVQIPVAYGGTAIAPASHPTVSGSESAFVDYSPFLNSGIDTQPGTLGFQGDLTNLTVNADSAQANGAGGNIQEGINMVNSGGNVTALAGTYSGNVDINRAVTLLGTPTFTGSLTTSAAGAAISPGFSPGIINSGDVSLSTGSNLNMQLNGTAVGTQYDQLNVTGTVSLGGATLNVLPGYSPTVADSFTIINNDGVDPVVGTFNGLAQGSTLIAGGNTYQISYIGGSGNDVTLTVTVVTCNDVSTPVMTSQTGVPVTIPINTTDLTTRGVISADFVFTYNTSVLDSTPANITVTPGAFLNGTAVITINKNVAGTIRVSVYDAYGINGAGALVNINMNVIGPIGSVSPLTLSGFLYNGGLLCSSSTSGTLTVISGTVAGKVTYENTLVLNYPVPNTNLNAPGTPTVSDVSDANGDYSLSGFGFGSYTVTPSRAAMSYLTPNGIFSNDAGLIAQHVVQLITLTPTQVNSALVGPLPTLTSFDAALIAQWIVGIPNPLNSTGTWRFNPANRNYANLNASYTSQGYAARLMGDVNGDWVTGNNRPIATRQEGSKDSVRASLPEIQASSGTEVIVPFRIDNLQGKLVGSYQFDVEYDPNVLEPSEVAADLTDTNSNGLAVVSNAPIPGLLKVAVYGAVPVGGDGTFVHLKFRTIGATGSTSPLAVRAFRVNDGNDEVITRDGQVTVRAAANNSVIRGRLVTAMGLTVANGRVTLTSSAGAVRTTISSSLGQFEFSELVVGETYTITVQAKRFAFTPRSVVVDGEAVEIQMIADQ